MMTAAKEGPETHIPNTCHASTCLTQFTTPQQPSPATQVHAAQVPALSMPAQVPALSMQAHTSKHNMLSLSDPRKKMLSCSDDHAAQLRAVGSSFGALAIAVSP
jgi:hypothetical protein